MINNKWCGIAAIFVTLSLLTACFQEDEPMPPYISPAGVVSNQIKLGKYYTTYAYYNLKNNQFLTTGNYDAWDLGFSTEADRYEMIINTQKKMRIGHTTKPFEEVLSVQDVEHWSIDRSGDSFDDSTAVGKWWNGNGISLDSTYVIDLGEDMVTGNPLGNRKMKIVNFINNEYHIIVSNLNGSQEQSFKIAKDNQYNHVYYSLKTNQQVYVEPLKTEWDLLFTQYMTVLFDGTTPMDYSVNGVLINAKNGVRAAVDRNKPFTEIKVSDLSSYSLLSNKDIIGHTWKSVGGIDGPISYSVENWTFLIKNVEGEYYKLRFTSFTDELGEKGSPAFEVGKF